MEKKSISEEVEDIFTDEYLYKYRGQPYRIRSMIEGFVSGKEAEAREKGKREALEQIQRVMEDEMLVIARDGTDILEKHIEEWLSKLKK